LATEQLSAYRRMRNQKIKTTLYLGDLQDSTPLMTPAVVVCGAAEGPMLWAQATIHGPEVGGLAGLIELTQTIDLADLKGTLVAVPAINPLAFRQAARLNPYDGLNMNRAFPGDIGGTFTEQAAARVFELAVTADCVLDLHSGGDRAVVPHYVIYHDDASAASTRSRELAHQLGLGIIWRATDDWLSGALFTRATKAGVPALIVESGGGTLDQRQVRTFVDSARRLMAGLGMLPGDDGEPAAAPIEIDGCAFVYNRRGGIYMPHAQAGDVVEEGDLIGRVVDLLGDVVEEIRNPKGRVCLTAVPVPYVPVESGHMIAEAVMVKTPTGSVQPLTGGKRG
jgi:predicted deacylase